MSNKDIEKKVPVEDDEISLIDLLIVLIKHRRLIILLTLIAALSVTAYSVISLWLPPEKSFLPNIYKSTAIMIVLDDENSSSSSLINSQLGNLAGLVGSGFSGGGNHELAEELLKSRTILDQISSEFDLQNYYNVTTSPLANTRNAILSHLTVDSNPSTGTFAISYEDVDPEFATNIVNRMTSLLNGLFNEIHGNKEDSKKKSLEMKLVDVKKKISSIETDIKAIQVKYGVLDINSLAQSQEVIISQLEGQLIINEMDIRTYSKFSSQEDSKLKLLRTKNEDLKQAIKNIKAGKSNYNSFGENIENHPDLPSLYQNFEHLKGSLSLQNSIYKSLVSQNELLKLSQEGEESVFQILEYAEIPDIKSKPSRGKLCIIVTMAVFFLSIFMAFILEFIAKIRKDPKSMEGLRASIKKN